MKFSTCILLGTFTLLSACSSPDSSTSEEVQKNYEHYIGGTFATMQSCLSFIEDEAGKAGMRIDISSDKPEKVTGSFNGDADMFFYCEIKETGTSGTFFEAAFPKFK